MAEAFYEHRSEEMSVGLSTGMDFPAHFHESLELFYSINEGSRVTVGDESVSMQPGELAVIFPNCIHSYASLPDSQEVARAILVIVPLSLTGEYRQILSEMRPDNPFLQGTLLHPDVVYAFSSFQREESSPNTRARRALVQLILSRVIPLLRLHKSSGEQSLLYQTVEILSREYREQISLDALSHQLGVSKYTVSRMFSEKLNCGFPEYLNRLRLSEAESMLLNTERSITEISYLCGFETPRTFNRAFLKHRHMTPREFRKLKTQE